MPTSLLQLCEPLFQYVCRINRAGRKGAAMEAGVVRAEIRDVFSGMEKNALETPGLSEQYRQVRLPLVFFCDYIIRSSSLPFSHQWQNLAEDESPPEYAGDQKFYLILDDLLKDRSEQANSRLAVYYTCMGLGFLGYYESDVQEVQRRMREIAARIRHLIDDDGQRRICPEAYDALDTSDLTEPPSRSIVPLVIALVCLVAVLFVANGYLYYKNAGELTRSIDRVIEMSESTAQPASAR